MAEKWLKLSVSAAFFAWFTFSPTAKRLILKCNLETRVRFGLLHPLFCVRGPVLLCAGLPHQVDAERILVEAVHSSSVRQVGGILCKTVVRGLRLIQLCF